MSLFAEFLFLQIFKKLISVAFEKRGLNLVCFDKLLDLSLELELSIRVLPDSLLNSVLSLHVNFCKEILRLQVVIRGAPCRVVI